MAQMTNTLYKYPNTESDNYIYRDYTYINYRAITTLTEIDDTYYDYYVVQDNEKIETISYNIYGTPDYWDVILGINTMDPLFDMIYNFDILSDSAESKLLEYEARYSQGTIPEPRRTELKNEILNELIENTDNNRNLKIVRPDKLQSFFRILRENGLLYA